VDRLVHEIVGRSAGVARPSKAEILIEKFHFLECWFINRFSNAIALLTFWIMRLKFVRWVVKPPQLRVLRAQTHTANIRLCFEDNGIGIEQGRPRSDCLHISADALAASCIRERDSDWRSYDKAAERMHGEVGLELRKPATAATSGWNSPGLTREIRCLSVLLAED